MCLGLPPLSQRTDACRADPSGGLAAGLRGFWPRVPGPGLPERQLSERRQMSFVTVNQRPGGRPTGLNVVSFEDSKFEISQ